jgi:DNA-directed RNA polymerase subunit RPC12/RpoP
MAKMRRATCPSCGIALSARESSIGSVIRCKNCGAKIRLSEPEEEPEKPKPSVLAGCCGLAVLLGIAYLAALGRRADAADVDVRRQLARCVDATLVVPALQGLEVASERLTWVSVVRHLSGNLFVGVWGRWPVAASVRVRRTGGCA